VAKPAERGARHGTPLSSGHSAGSFHLTTSTGTRSIAAHLPNGKGFGLASRLRSPASLKLAGSQAPAGLQRSRALMQSVGTWRTESFTHDVGNGRTSSRLLLAYRRLAKPSGTRPLHERRARPWHRCHVARIRCRRTLRGAWCRGRAAPPNGGSCARSPRRRASPRVAVDVQKPSDAADRERGRDRHHDAGICALRWSHASRSAARETSSGG
jgi:hypothetical protein